MQEWASVARCDKTVAIIAPFPVQVGEGRMSGLELRGKREDDKKKGEGESGRKEKEAVERGR